MKVSLLSVFSYQGHLLAVISFCIKKLLQNSYKCILNILLCLLYSNVSTVIFILGVARSTFSSAKRDQYARRKSEMEISMRLRLCDCIVAVHVSHQPHQISLLCWKVPAWSCLVDFIKYVKANNFLLVFFFSFHFNACLFFFFLKFRPKQLRKAPSCWAEFRKTCSADILDFASGLKCQQADFSFFSPL